jgi:hypothetical protein
MMPFTPARVFTRDRVLHSLVDAGVSAVGCGVGAAIVSLTYQHGGILDVVVPVGICSVLTFFARVFFRPDRSTPPFALFRSRAR